jgi:hypothetical protein
MSRNAMSVGHIITTTLTGATSVSVTTEITAPQTVVSLYSLQRVFQCVTNLDPPLLLGEIQIVSLREKMSLQFEIKRVGHRVVGILYATFNTLISSMCALVSSTQLLSVNIICYTI